MTKYRLKKDTPEFKAGTVFDMIENVDVGNVLTMNAPREDDYAFEVDSIDNFDEWFEEVKQPGWKEPNRGDSYYFINGAGVITSTVWMDNSQDRVRYLMGNCFRTTEAADRFANYLKAVATVSQDEGFMLQTTKGDGAVDSDVATVVKEAGSFRVRKIDYVYRRAGAFYFDTCGHAYSSIAKHYSAWQTIYDYKWGKE